MQDLAYLQDKFELNGMIINAGVASIAVPLLHTQRHYFVFGQAVFLLLALSLWYISRRRHID